MLGFQLLAFYQNTRQVDSLAPRYETLKSGAEMTLHQRSGLRRRKLSLWARNSSTAVAGFFRGRRSAASWSGSPTGLLSVLLLFLVALPLAGRDKDKLRYGEGLIINIPAPENEVEQVVQDIAQNGIIRGTKEYNRDEYVSGAKAATSSKVFPAWNEGGKVFYKVREHAIDPRNFRDSSDAGTLVVRYVLQAQGEKNTVLRIDALFEEDFRHMVHQSDGSVESAEYKDIHEHIEAIEVMKKQTAEAEAERQEQLVKKQNLAMPSDAPAASALQSPPQNVPQAAEGSTNPSAPAGQAPPGQTLEEHVKDLRRQVERLVKAPGAPLKSAPFHTASTLQSLTTGTEVLILISTPYWYGIETHEGQHGWILRDELEQP
jgi:hypothetical protein